MKLINKFLKLFNLTYVVRNQHDLSINLNNLSKRSKRMLILAYNSLKEKILFETKYYNN